MWARLSDHKAVNMNTGTSLEIERERQIVYVNVYLFKKILINQEMKWEYNDVWGLFSKSGKVSHNIYKGSEEDCITLFNSLLEKISNNNINLDISN